MKVKAVAITLQHILQFTKLFHMYQYYQYYFISSSP